jgi:hypothetical protein
MQSLHVLAVHDVPALMSTSGHHLRFCNDPPAHSHLEDFLQLQTRVLNIVEAAFKDVAREGTSSRIAIPSGLCVRAKDLCAKLDKRAEVL